jgi:hypothetical protein
MKTFEDYKTMTSLSQISKAQKDIMDNKKHKNAIERLNKDINRSLARTQCIFDKFERKMSDGTLKEQIDKAATNGNSRVLLYNSGWIFGPSRSDVMWFGTTGEPIYKIKDALRQLYPNDTFKLTTYYSEFGVAKLYISW